MTKTCELNKAKYENWTYLIKFEFKWWLMLEVDETMYR